MATDPVPPPGADERRRYQRLGEALLTEDGRITSTPQAKTLAIETLATRMRSSTPELVLAAMGLTVGNEMAGRLGDSQYVLVAHNEDYPSMVADVLHVDELRTEAWRPYAPRAVRMDTEEAERLVRRAAVSELMSAWSYGSNNNARALALQEVTRGEFELQGVLDWEMDRRMRRAVDLELSYNRNALSDFLRTQYVVTQEVLQDRGITDLLSYRVLGWSEPEEWPRWAADDNVGKEVEARQRPLSSWSADRQVVVAWLAEHHRGGVILAARHSAEDLVSVPMTGMGFLGQKEWVTLPGDRRAVIDGVVGGPRITERRRSAAAGVALGDPASANSERGGRALASGRGGHADAAEPRTTPAAAPRWRPAVAVPRLSAPDELDTRIGRILDGAEEAPSWWPRDDSGYGIRRRDLEFLRIDPQHLRWILTGAAPMGLTPSLYQQFAGDMGEALRQDRIDAAQVDIRLKGTAAGFFSGLHKTLPTEAELAGRPTALERMREWFGGDENRPLRRPFDAMYRLGLEPEPSDFDLDINSTAAVRAARAYWREHHRDRFAGDFMGGHGYLDKQVVHGALPHLAEWAKRWEDRLSRPVSLGVFESTGPFNEAALGRRLSAHFKDSDWHIHRYQKYAGPNPPIPEPRVAASCSRPEHLRRSSATVHSLERAADRC